jgi:hypothetical protein
MDSTTRVALETRKAMIAVATVTWEDENETVRTARARIEDTSPSGACLWLKVPIRSGTRVEVSWCRDDLSGKTKRCRDDDGEYVLGMQRDRIANKTLTRIVASAHEAETPTVREVQREVRREVLPEERGDVTASGPSPVQVQVTAMLQNVPPAHQPLIRRGTLLPMPRPRPLPLMKTTFPPAVMQKPMIGFEIALETTRHEAMNHEHTDSSAQNQKRTTSFFEARTEMPNKWLNLGSKGQQEEGANGSGGSGAAHFSPGMTGDTTLAPPRGDLPLHEDIYRTAGIMEPRTGYSITKVVEMLGSDHLRGLSEEVKRASVLMALTAAGIPLGDILQDAARRQAAVAAYDVEQRMKFEEYWSRRAEENSSLQTEMERVTRQYVERTNRNLTEVQQEKEAFQKWQTAMQHEVLQISEAVTLCAQPAVYESSIEQAAGGGQGLVAKSARVVAGAL